MITVVMPSFYSAKLVKERILEIGNDTQILIVENSKDMNLKTDLEKNFNNVKVIIPKENMGWGKSINLGIKNSKTEMVFITQPDVKLIKNCIQKLKECILTFNDFAILTPVDENNEIYQNYENLKFNSSVIDNNKFQLKEVDYVDLTWLINKSKFVEKDLWDEKIFLYFEAKDFSKRVKDSYKKIFIAETINTYHIGSASHDPKFEYFNKLNRSWHYNWSKHYFNKKHHGIIFAYKKSFGQLSRLILKFLGAAFFLKFLRSKFILVEIYGLLSSMLCLPSFYRPYKNIK